MAQNRSESSVPRHENSSQFLSERDVCSIIGGEIVTELPNTGQEHEMRIPGNAEIQQMADRIVSTMYRDDSLQC
jgi:hypothetical protein